MADFKDRMADYVPVNERVEAFKAAFPEGSLQSEIVELTPGRVTVKALAYRTPDDPRPGIGHSSLEIPGSTPYTRGSEIENAETSAWGRAIAALGFEVKRGLASAEEVRNKQPQGGERAAPVGGARPATTRPVVQRTPEENALLDELLAVPGMSTARMSLLSKAVDVKGERATADELREMLALTVMPLPDAPGPAVPDEAPALTLDDVLAVTGGELVEDGSNITLRMAPPAKPGTAEYKEYSAQTKAEARAYWQQQGVTA